MGPDTYSIGVLAYSAAPLAWQACTVLTAFDDGLAPRNWQGMRLLPLCICNCVPEVRWRQPCIRLLDSHLLIHPLLNLFEFILNLLQGERVRSLTLEQSQLHILHHRSRHSTAQLDRAAGLETAWCC